MHIDKPIASELFNFAVKRHAQELAKWRALPKAQTFEKQWEEQRLVVAAWSRAIQAMNTLMQESGEVTS